MGPSPRARALVDLRAPTGRTGAAPVRRGLRAGAQHRAPGRGRGHGRFLLDLSMDERQRVLETIDLTERLRLCYHAAPARSSAELTRRCRRTPAQSYPGPARYFLRQQLKPSRSELGEAEEEPRLEELRERWPRRAYRGGAEAAEREMKRGKHESGRRSTTSRAPTSSGWMCPGWWARRRRSTSPTAQHVLDEDHYDLDDVTTASSAPAVRRLRPEAMGPILLRRHPRPLEYRPCDRRNPIASPWAES